MVVDDSKADVVLPVIHPGYGDHEENEDGIDANAETSADRAMASFQVKRIKLDLSPPAESQSSPATVAKSTPSTSTSASASVPKNKRSARQIGKQKADIVAKASKSYSSTDSNLTVSGDGFADEDHVMADDEARVD